jgi:hypothetical protein
MKPEISHLIHLSTAHIRKETGDWIDQNHVYHASHEYGWFVWVDEDMCRAEDGSDILQFGDETVVPADLIACMRFAQQHGCTWFVLDCDVNPIPELPTYEWEETETKEITP